MIEKQKEETNEIEQAYMVYLATGSVAKLQEVVNETFDSIQVGVGILDKASTIEGIDIPQSSQDHLVKLANRGWKVKRVLTIE